MEYARVTPQDAEVPHRTAAGPASAPLVPGEHYITPSYLRSAGIPSMRGYLLQGYYMLQVHGIAMRGTLRGYAVRGITSRVGVIH